MKKVGTCSYFNRKNNLFINLFSLHNIHIPVHDRFYEFRISLRALFVVEDTQFFVFARLLLSYFVFFIVSTRFKV